MVKWCAFDVEGDVNGTGIRGVSLCTDGHSEYYDNSSHALSQMRTFASEGYRFVAHNAEYDITVLLWASGEDCRIVYCNGRFNRGEWRFGKPKRRAQIWDTLGLSGGLPLAAVGEAMRLPKLPTPQVLEGKDPDKYKWRCQKHDIGECIECYAVRDAEITFKYIVSYEEYLNMHTVPPKRTIGSAAVALWKQLDKQSPCHLPKYEYAQFARLAYFGGRVECFKVGRIMPCYTADVQSMYPSVMLTTPMPNPRTLNLNQSSKALRLIETYEGIADVLVSVPNMHVPPLPMQRDDKLYFPVGRFRGIWTNYELRHAMHSGVVIERVYKVLYSTDTLYPFSEYVTTLSAERQALKEAKDPRQLTTKILQNSLYGRLGLREVQEQETISIMPPGKDFKDFQGYYPTMVENHVYLSKTISRRTPSPYANVMWAAQITAAARVRLREYLILQGSELVYCDTDSVFSQSPIHGIEDGLGKLTDSQVWDSASIIGPKLYRLESITQGNKVRAKGVPKKVAEQFLTGQEVTFSAPVKPKDAQRRHIEAGTWIDFKKQWRRAPAKRTILNPDYAVGSGGWSDTTPVSFVPSGEEVAEEIESG